MLCTTGTARDILLSFLPHCYQAAAPCAPTPSSCLWWVWQPRSPPRCLCRLGHRPSLPPQGAGIASPLLGTSSSLVPVDLTSGQCMGLPDMPSGRLQEHGRDPRAGAVRRIDARETGTVCHLQAWEQQEQS